MEPTFSEIVMKKNPEDPDPEEPIDERFCIVPTQCYMESLEMRLEELQIKYEQLLLSFNELKNSIKNDRPMTPPPMMKMSKKRNFFACGK